MEKNVVPYKQRGDTCAIVCMMMVLEYYKIIEKVNWYDEKRLYRIYHSRYMNGTPFSAIAFHIAKKGLNVSIYHESKNLFENNSCLIDQDTFENALKEYKEYLKYAKNNGAKIINGIPINTKLLKQKLLEDNLIILAGQTTYTYHSILLTGYNNLEFIICDPLHKTKQSRSFDEIENFINTNIGKWFITINNRMN